VGGALLLFMGAVESVLRILSGDWEGAAKAWHDTVESFFNLVLSLTGTNLEEFRATWENNFMAVKLIIDTFATQFGLWASNLLIDALVWVTDMGTKLSGLYDVGLQAIQGLWDGMKSKWGEMMAWVVEKVDAIIAKIKEALHMKSPSGVMAAIGQNMMEGMALGISAGTPAAMYATQRAAQGMMNSAVNTTNQYYNLTIHTQSSPNIPASFGRLRTLAAVRR